MIDEASHFSDADLDVLLFGDEGSDEFLQCASHLEACAECRDRLTQVAADDSFWSEACESLVETRAELATMTSPWGVVASQAAVERQLECLAPPSHPEMLGRLGRYDIERVIGAGGMGIVLKGFDTELNRPVAVKLLAPHLAHSGAARQRFARESRAAAAIVHEHVVAIHNVESEGRTPFLVMQYVAGESLQARVDREGPLDEVALLRIGVQAAAGLAAAHEQGVVHRDIKPANILLEEGVERALLTDFGLARTVDDASLTHTGVVAGTPHYMSPEQAGGEAVDHRTDLFSLGAVLYFMATGHPPFRADRAMGVLNRICNDQHRPVWQVNPQIPDDVSDIIDRLLEKRPGRRFADADQVREALMESLSRVQRGGRGRYTKVRRLLRRHRRWLLTTIGFGVAGVISVAMFAIVPWGATSDDGRPLARPQGGPQDTTWADAIEYSNVFGDVQGQIQRLEEASQAVYLHIPGSDWDGEMRSVNAQLDRLEREQASGDEIP